MVRKIIPEGDLMVIACVARPVAALSIAAAFLLLAGCGEGQKQASAPPPPAVTVAKPIERTVVDQDEYVGRFVAVDSVEIRSRVSGYLSEIHFTDGQLVRKGDLLFVIDHKPFQIALDQMRANLAQARANLAFTEADLARGQELVRNKTMTEQVFDQRKQAKSVAEAGVSAQEAMVHQAELDLNEYSNLRAPIDGRIGDRRVSVGNLVTGGNGSNTTLLATIVSVDPIRFEFTFDEASYLRYQRFAGATGKMANADNGIAVTLKLIDEDDFSHTGRMDFVDNVIDKSSGTIRGRAVFANPDGHFTPGMFGRIRVPGSLPHTTLLVSDAALGTEQSRKYVLVVDDSNTVRLKYVTPAQLDGGLRVIKEGLAANDRVIVNGLMRARPGGKVTPQEEGAPPAPSAAKEASKNGAQTKAD
jgi:RND family efflux transporter MFP subunit